MAAPEIPIEAKVLAFLFQGIEAEHRKNLPVAGKLFEAALRLADAAPTDEAIGLRALGFCCMTLLRIREGRAEDAVELHREAITLVDVVSKSDLRQKKPFPELMSSLLIDLKEYKRAIVFCERAIELELEMNDPLQVAELLLREGHCYSRCGLKDQASIPLRAALKILRGYPEEPSLTSVLIGLGNALRKSSPTEAESLYKEVAEIYSSKAQMESATPAWGNLGILCSEQGRYAEALNYYQKVLDIRENAAESSKELVAMTLNNIAGCHQLAGNFAEALAFVDRAIAMLDGGENSRIAAAYGTRGHILHDMGGDAEAVVWLQRSYSERMKQANPNYEPMLENLGYEITCLRRLGRLEEVSEAEGRVAQIKEAMDSFPAATVDVSSMGTGLLGAVLIELAFGKRNRGRYGLRDAEAVLKQIFAILSEKGLAESGNRVMIPESITLTFYGKDGEAMFAAMEQFLTDHLIFAGAIISVRQGTSIRQIVIPGSVN